MFNKIKDMAFDLFFPENLRCESCGEELFGSELCYCKHCLNRLVEIKPYACHSCGKILKSRNDNFCADCYGTYRHFNSGISLYGYNDFTKAMILNYKYKDKRFIGKTMGLLMTDAVWEIKDEFDLIIPVPISINRRLIRGFNQMEYIAKIMGEELNIEVCDDVLLRKKSDKYLKKLKKDERFEELKKIFFCVENSNILGKNILLIDDILTTGTTLNMCSLELKKAGADKITVLTFCSGL